MLIRKVEKTALIRVLNKPNGRFYHVIKEEYEVGKRDLNTYTRGGNIVTARGATVPVGRENVEEAR